jgi:Domain of unknown function (DUF4823)
MLRKGLVLLTVVLAGCTSTYTQSDLSSPTVKLERGKVVAIATPANGSYGGKEYAGSGQSTATAVRAAFAKFARETSVVSECQTLSCLTEKVGATVDYLVIPEILRWEDRATEWSGIKDKLEVKLAIYDARSGKELAASSLGGKSKWATFGGDHPQDLLPEPINGYVASLF